MASLKKSQAWKWFAKYIKERDKWTCITCGRVARGQGMDAGHFIQAFGHQATFFDETNVHAQCSHCNCAEGGNLLVYRRKIIELYGEGYDKELERLGREIKQYTKKERDEISKVYKKKYEDLINGR